jgi:hypothetical protein
LRGASATEKLLTQHPEWKVHVFAVWEPILPTDWGAPSGSTLGRLSDARVRQFWDPKHEVSRALGQMASATPSEPAPNSGKGFYWDEAIVYAPREQWHDARPLFWRGPVFQVIGGLAAAIQSAAPVLLPGKASDLPRSNPGTLAAPRFN